MRVLIATDAWRPQVNGVVRTYERLAEEVVKLGTVDWTVLPLVAALPVYLLGSRALA